MKSRCSYGTLLLACWHAWAASSACTPTSSPSLPVFHHVTLPGCIATFTELPGLHGCWSACSQAQHTDIFGRAPARPHAPAHAICSRAQAHAGYSGSPDMDTNPTFTMVANNIQINNWQVVVKLPPVSLSVIVF